MTTITHEALCRNEFCPEPRNPDFHECVACGRPAVEHAHIVARSRAPSRRKDKNNVVALCHEHHELQTLNKWAFHEQALPFEGLVHQWMTDERGATVWKRDVRVSPAEGEAQHEGGLTVPSSVAEPSTGTEASLSAADVRGPRATAENVGGFSDRAKASSAVAPGASSDGGKHPEGRGGGVSPFVPVEVGGHLPPSPDAGADSREPPKYPAAVTRSSVTDPSGGGGVVARSPSSPPISESLKPNGLDLPSEFTFHDWTQLAKMVTGMNMNRQWWAGDLILAGERFGERATQHWNDLGYRYESLANCVRVCRRFPRPLRRESLQFSHHAVVYALDDVMARRWLSEANDHGWTVKQLREAVHGVKPRTVRYSVESLREALAAWPGEPRVRNNGPRYLAAALDWLEGR